MKYVALSFCVCILKSIIFILKTKKCLHRIFRLDSYIAKKGLHFYSLLLISIACGSTGEFQHCFRIHEVLLFLEVFLACIEMLFFSLVKMYGLVSFYLYVNDYKQRAVRSSLLSFAFLFHDLLLK